MARSIAAFESWRRNTFAAMNDGHFRVLFIGTLFATFAYMMMFLAMSVVSYDLSGTNTAVGVIGTGVGLAMLLAPFGGVIADRMNRKWVIVVGQGGGAAMLALTGVLLLLGQMTLPLMFVLMLGLGFTFVVMGPARNAFTADLVGPHLIGNAMVLSQLSHTIGQPFSPFIAALLLESAAGSGGTYLVMGALVAVGVFTVAVMPNRRRQGETAGTSAQAAQRRGVLADIVDGGRYVWRRRTLRLMLLMFVSTVVIGFLFRILTPAFLDQHLDRPTTDMGQLFLVNGIAAAIISFVVAGLATTRWAWPATLLLVASLGVGYFVLAASQTFVQAMIAMAILGPGLQGPVMILQARIMMNTESAYYGRVMAFTMMAWGVQMVFAGPAGVVADLIGEREVFGMMGVAAFAVTVLGTLGWLAIRKDDHPALPSALPAPAGVAASTNGGSSSAPTMPPPPMLRPVALMSGQKIDR
ncbi:MAG: MFS transporter [Chloroflexota bacterium]|nr:MFS transporter [Chloroflexota bacterium]MDE2895341.1 MFS transporter [Chloroflexota bacterium]